MTTSATTDLRSRLLFRRREDGRHGDRADLPREVSGVEAGLGGTPVLGSQLEVPVAGPVGEDADHIPQVVHGIEVVEPAGGDEREEVPGTLAVSIAPDEQPI